MSTTPTSNCYGFICAAINNSDQEMYKARNELPSFPCLTRKLAKIHKNSEETALKIFDILSGAKNRSHRKILELFDESERSQHMALLDEMGKVYDQNGPDGEIRLKNNLEELLREYRELFDTSYYQIHSLNPQQSENVTAFIKEYRDFMT